MGLKIQKLYLEGDDVEFATFETPLDKKGKKIHIDDPDMDEKSIQPYFDDIGAYKLSLEIKNGQNISVKQKGKSMSEKKEIEDNISEDTKSSSVDCQEKNESLESPSKIL